MKAFSLFRKLNVSEVPSKKKKSLTGKVKVISAVSFNLDDLPEFDSCTGSMEGSLVSGYTVNTVGSSMWRKGKMKKKVREAVISDETEYTETETD